MSQTDLEIGTESQLYKGKNTPIQGMCLTMCPNAELRLRQRENLIHLLESKVNQKGQRLEFADSKTMVKEFSRSSPGQQVIPSNIRPSPILHKTVVYLLSVVCSHEDVSWRQIYDFVNDRLRAVRQDIAIQCLEGKEVVKILAPAARFYIYAHYRLCEYEESEFDPTLNLQQLNEILLTILAIYKNNPSIIDSDLAGCKFRGYSVKTPNLNDNFIDEEEPSANVSQEGDLESKLNELTLSNSSNYNRLNNTCHTNVSLHEANVSKDCASPIHNSYHSNSHSDVRSVTTFQQKTDHDLEDPQDTKYQNCTESMVKETALDKYTICEMVSLYILIHIGRPETISFVLQIAPQLRQSTLVSRVMHASMSWMVGNHLPLVRLAHWAPPSLSPALHLHLNKVQKHALGVLSVAHNSESVKYPVEALRRHLLFPSNESLQKACQHYGLSVAGDGVQFLKKHFKWNAPVCKPEKANWVNRKLKELSVSELLLAGC